MSKSKHGLAKNKNKRRRDTLKLTSIKLSSPLRYPSSWVPILHGIRWSKLKPLSTGMVLAKSIIHAPQISASYMMSKELPMICQKNNGVRLFFIVMTRMLNPKLTSTRFLDANSLCDSTVLSLQCLLVNNNKNEAKNVNNKTTKTTKLYLVHDAWVAEVKKKGS